MNLNLFQLRSLKTRITLFTLLIFVVSIWSLALYISRGLHDDMQRQLGEQQLATASLIADDINQQLTDRLDALAAIADELPAEYLTRPGLLQARLEQRPLLHILFNGGVFATDVRGTAIADVPLSVGADWHQLSGPRFGGDSAARRPGDGWPPGAGQKAARANLQPGGPHPQ